MIITKEVKIICRKANKKYYEGREDEYIAGIDIFIALDNLSHNSSIRIETYCDYCLENGINTICNKSYKEYLNQRKDVAKDCCSTCQSKKIKDVSMKKYGVENPSQTPEAIQKIENVFLQKYGVKNIMFLPETFDKILATTEERYGYKYILGTNYGRERFSKTMYSNSTSPCSSQQKHIWNILGGELNYPISGRNVDIAFLDEKIYLECDFSGHWMNIHRNKISETKFYANQISRTKQLLDCGWKEFRIISRNDNIPTTEVLFWIKNHAFDYLKSGRHFINYDLDNGTIKTSSYEYQHDFGELKKFTNKDYKILYDGVE